MSYLNNIKTIIFTTIFLIVCVGSALDVKSQDFHNTFSSMTGVAQSAFVNPAYLSKYKVVVAVPGLGLGLNAQVPLSYNQVLQKEGDRYVVNVTNVLNDLKDQKNVGVNTQLDVLFVSFRVIPRWHVHFYSTVNIQTFLTIPEKISNVILDGNSVNVPYNIELSGVVNSWLENALGVSYQVNKRITAGARLKFNKGIFGAKVNSSKGTLVTRDTNIEMSAEFDVQASDLKRIRDDIKWENFNQYIGGLTVGLDLGGTYNHDDKWWVGVALKNIIGSVKYDVSRRYSLSKATYTYRGTNIQDAIDNKQVKLETELSKAFKADENEEGEFSNALPTTYFLNGEYVIMPNLRAGGTFALQSNVSDTVLSYGVHVAKDFGRIFSLSLSFNRLYGQFSGGVGTSLQLGAFQMYLASDSVLSAGLGILTSNTVSYIKDTRALNLKFGINLVFGRIKNQLQFKNI